MASLKLNKNLRLFFSLKLNKYNLGFNRRVSTETADDEFRVLELYPRKQSAKKVDRPYFKDAQVIPPREKRMPIDQDWPSVWPTAKTFRPSSVPLPLYQGYDQKRAPPGKYANAELMKIPNFLHLTPPAIERHCNAIKKFCTEWPKGLETEEDCRKHFPVQIIESDYLHSSPSVHDERSRIVTLKVKLVDLNLDYHGRDKILRLLGGRYEENSDTIVLVADRCPTRQQNYDYLIYLLTALHHESWITEPWEHEKAEADMEKFFFEGSRIQKKIIKTIKQSKHPKSSLSEEELKTSKEVEYFEEAVCNLLNEGEVKNNMLKYKDAVVKALITSS
ncbi:28S ribosomal protein S35, mitochondrial [Trichonephila inaurata madagascariensis]|uniref:28S ribosomal protein S35, mitochondrial n=1 Tax=Trichonephila inaurata madagascariensis TaxID=2747483 RepID=A0A8X7C9D9_9ARAC|nr:28S ribosomal protein S35, mitochondrial [Trichonephila inaurata madagascariensis]